MGSRPHGWGRTGLPLPASRCSPPGADRRTARRDWCTGPPACAPAAESVVPARRARQRSPVRCRRSNSASVLTSGVESCPIRTGPDVTVLSFIDAPFRAPPRSRSRCPNGSTSTLACLIDTPLLHRARSPSASYRADYSGMTADRLRTPELTGGGWAPFSHRAATNARTPQKTKSIPTRRPIAQAAELGRLVRPQGPPRTTDRIPLMAVAPDPSAVRPNCTDTNSDRAPVANSHTARTKVRVTVPLSGKMITYRPAISVSRA